jgi:hypothetical protein
MVCERCGTVFCPDCSDGPVLYCSASCRNGAKQKRKRHAQEISRRRRARRAGCRTPLKHCYGEFADAAAAALEVAARHPEGKPLHPYECPCGAWHLTRKAPRPVTA